MYLLQTQTTHQIVFHPDSIRHSISDRHNIQFYLQPLSGSSKPQSQNDPFLPLLLKVLCKKRFCVIFTYNTIYWNIFCNCKYYHGKRGNENLYILFTRMTLHTSQNHRLLWWEFMWKNVFTISGKYSNSFSTDTVIWKSESARILFNNFIKYISQYIYIF